jgi:hypothetical protein
MTWSGKKKGQRKWICKMRYKGIRGREKREIKERKRKEGR